MNPTKSKNQKEIPIETAVPHGNEETLSSPGETDDGSKGFNKIQMTTDACIVEAHESTRKRLERIPSKGREDHITEKGFSSLSHYNLAHKFVPMPQAIKFPDAKAALDKEWKKLEKMPAWQLEKVKKEFWKHKESRQVHFAAVMDICHAKSVELESQHQKNKGGVALRSDTVKNDSGSYVVFTE